jgi:hypothetical protein
MEREDGMLRLLKPVACAVTALGFVFVLFGAFSGSFSADDRTALNSSYGGEGLNVNTIALISDFVIMWIAGFLPMAFQSRFAKITKTGFLLKVLFMFGALVSIMVLIKTGSRNGALALIPAFYYMIFCFKGVSMVKRFLISTILLIVMVGFVIVSGVNVSSLRIFNYSGGYKGEVTNGRTMFHLRIIDSMREDEKLWGIGTHSYNAEKFNQVGMSNGHSVYFQIFVQTGYIGSVLFLLSMLVMFVSLLRVRSVDGINWKWLGYTFVLAWMFTGIGESVNYISDLPSPKTAFGFALAICSQRWILRKRYMQAMPYGGGGA